MCQTKVFRGDMKSLNPLDLAKTPKEIQPANEHYLQRLRLIFNSHSTGNDFATFVEGVLLWDESMADTAARYLKAHPQSRMVCLLYTSPSPRDRTRSRMPSSA